MVTPPPSGDAQSADALLQKDRANMAASQAGPEPYVLGPDSLPQAGVPRGQVTPHRWHSERIFPNTQRDYWVYVPQQYDGTQPACLLVFQDGGQYLGPEANTAIVLDNLIHQRTLPVTIGVFVSPGELGPGTPLYGGSSNRSLEYDTLSDQYARFLLEELLPPLEQNYKLVSDPAGRAIGGMSSGGICAFTAAWERPDAFGNVISHCGSFADIRGGHVYPWLVRHTERKPLRVFLQTGANDLDILCGNWPLANQEMAAALAYRGYDHQFVLGVGGHTLKHGASLLPDTLRWLWRDYPQRS